MLVIDVVFVVFKFAFKLVFKLCDFHTCVENEDDDGHDFHSDCCFECELTPEVDFRCRALLKRLLKSRGETGIAP